MKTRKLTRAERVVRQISELRELGRRLFMAGSRAGLHTRCWMGRPVPPQRKRR